MNEQDGMRQQPMKPDYMALYENVVHGDFYGADYYRSSDSNNESAITYDDSEDKRTMAGLLATSFGPKRSLEVGCATGLMVKAMRAYGVEADGFDFSHWCIEHASDQVREWVRWDDVLKLAQPAKPYDLVLALDVLEHLPPEQVPAALANIATSTAPGGIVFAVIPAYGPNQYGPEIFKLELDSWRRDAALGIPFVDLPLDDKGRPHLGHLTHATIAWWEQAFARAGLLRLGRVERLLHERYDSTLQFARRSFFVFVKAGRLGRWRMSRRLLPRIGAVPGLPRGFWAWERCGANAWMHWLKAEAWEPIETNGHDRLRVYALCNHPDIAGDAVTVTFSVDDGPSCDVVFCDHDWHAIDLEVPRRRFIGLGIRSSRTWAPPGETEGVTPRALGVGLAYQWAPPIHDAAVRPGP
jgi:SAM-dependent methyltransferase